MDHGGWHTQHVYQTMTEHVHSEQKGECVCHHPKQHQTTKLFARSAPKDERVDMLPQQTQTRTHTNTQQTHEHPPRPPNYHHQLLLQSLHCFPQQLLGGVQPTRPPPCSAWGATACGVCRWGASQQRRTGRRRVLLRRAAAAQGASCRQLEGRRQGVPPLAAGGWCLTRL